MNSNWYTNQELNNPLDCFERNLNNPYQLYRMKTECKSISKSIDEEFDEPNRNDLL